MMMIVVLMILVFITRISFDDDHDWDQRDFNYDAAADAAGDSGDDGRGDGGGGIVMYSSLTVLGEFNSTILTFFCLVVDCRNCFIRIQVS